MSFQCADLDEALRSEQLAPNAQAAQSHIQTCEHCRERVALWQEISDVAPQLREEWESPWLWARIQGGLQATPKRQGLPIWQWAAAAAALALLTVGMYQLLPSKAPIETPIETATVARPDPNQPFLNAETIKEVQSAEAAYVVAIEKLTSAAGPSLKESSTPLAAVYREKLLLLDEAIADLKAGVESNRYNVYLQTQLASLYQEKQKTLEEWLNNAKSN
jgi:anti-sigma factor RsiW